MALAGRATGTSMPCCARCASVWTEAVRRGAVESVGVAAWGVDYGLLDRFGRLLGPVHSYRSSRTDGVLDEVVARVGRERIFRITGSQFLPINTLYQLVSARGTAEVAQAERLLMMPDVVNHELCGSTTTDVTAASTTQLLDVSTRTWSDELAAAAGLRRDLLPPLHEPGCRCSAPRTAESRWSPSPATTRRARSPARHCGRARPMSTSRAERGPSSAASSRRR